MHQKVDNPDESIKQALRMLPTKGRVIDLVPVTNGVLALTNKGEFFKVDVSGDYRQVFVVEGGEA